MAKKPVVMSPKGGEEYAKHRKTGDSDLDYKLAVAAHNNSRRGGAREARVSGGKTMPEGVRPSWKTAELDKKSVNSLRKNRPLTGVVTDRRGSVEVPNVSIPGVEKKAKRKGR